MNAKKNVLVIVGSASKNSANQNLVDRFIELSEDAFDLSMYNDLKILPPFDPSLSADNPPEQIVEFRNALDKADGILICTPEYIFSIPSGLKNVIEWCVATTIFSDKPVGIITASLDGQKGHEELQLIMRTLTAKLTADTSLLIQGVRGKIDKAGQITDTKTLADLKSFVTAYKTLLQTARE
jgi:NAD(P)H-dependent FMN reductase